MNDSHLTSAPRRAARTVVIALLAACAACSSVTPSQRPSGDSAVLEQRARAAVEAGNLATAADLYTQLAAASSGTARIDFLLTAASLAADYGDTAMARRRLADARSGASLPQQQTSTVIAARLDLMEGRPQAALDALATLPATLPQATQADAAAVRGEALFRLGRVADAVRVLVEREVWLEDAAAILANQRLIWDGLRNQPSAAAPPATGDPIVDGWLALAPVASNVGEDLRRSLLEWRRTYTAHPAAAGLLAELLAAQRSTAFPSQIALLLPLSSPQRAAALAVRDGFMAAHLRNPSGAATNLRVYDSTRLGPREAYLQAQLDGADFIVGPLLRPEVNEVIAEAGFVPTLALNYATSDSTLSRSFYQFALAPEDEGRAIAAAAIADGARTAIAIVPSNQRGYEIRDDFRAAFEQAGGEVLDWTGYEPALQDFSTLAATVLNIRRSVERERRLAANLGVPLQFEARRRQDVDMIFFVAFEARPGRMLAPQLRFYGAGDIPIYATAQIFDPSSTGRENDLNGFIFADTPALLIPSAEASDLRANVQSYWPQNATNLRLYGMGYDAYGLVGSLYASDGGPWSMRGMSGDLSLDSQGRVRRVLPLAQFRGGRPVALDASSLQPIDSTRLIGRR